MTPFPAIRVTLEGMRHEMLHAFGAHQREVEQVLSEETKKLIEGFDFAAAVRSTMEPILKEAIRDALERHFKYGAGREVIQAGVRAALGGAAD